MTTFEQNSAKVYETTTQMITDVAINREAFPKFWYVAQVQMNCEKKSAQRISALGIETFVPIQEEVHQWSDRKRKIEKVLIPLIVFFKADNRQAKNIEKLSFVHSLMSLPGQKKPATISNEEIERFKFMVNHCKSEITMEPIDIKRGDKIKVVKGDLAGLIGYAAKDTNKKSRILVALDILGYASVNVQLSDIQVISTEDY